MTEVTYAQVRAFLAASTRGAGKCLGTVGNDLTGHFGSYPHAPYSAKVSANELTAAGLFHTTACPSYSHFDFYNFVQDGVNYGHIDFHAPEQGLHYADSSRITVKLNKLGTVGTYASWGTRLGWAEQPALNATMPRVVLNATPALTATQRKVKSTGKVNRRTGPGTSYPEVVPQNDLAVNTVGNMVAFAHGPASKGQPAGNDVWYKGISGDWFWSGGFTTVDGSNLTDLTASFADPVVVTPPPVVDPPVVVPPPVETPPDTTPVDPPVTTDPPVVDPPVVDPPATDPPVTDPPVTDPPVTEPPATDPPVTPPVTTKPANNWLGGVIAVLGVGITALLGWLLSR